MGARWWAATIIVSAVLGGCGSATERTTASPRTPTTDTTVEGEAPPPSMARPGLTPDEITAVDQRLRAEAPFADITTQWTVSGHKLFTVGAPSSAPPRRGAEVWITIDPPTDLAWDHDGIECIDGHYERVRMRTCITQASYLAAFVRLDGGPTKVLSDLHDSAPPGQEQEITVLHRIGPPEEACSLSD